MRERVNNTSLAKLGKCHSQIDRCLTLSGSYLHVPHYVSTRDLCTPYNLHTRVCGVVHSCLYSTCLCQKWGGG